MSKAALTFLVLTFMSLAIDQLLTPPVAEFGVIAPTCAAVFGSLFVMALVVGRRIKFDPVLR